MTISAKASVRIIPVTSPLLLGVVEEELAAHLPPAGRELLALVGFNSFLACRLVLDGERVVGRLILDHEHRQPAMRTIRELGLFCRRSRFDYQARRDSVHARRRHQGGFVPREQTKGSHAMIYFGLDEAFCDGAELAEIHYEHGLVGELFGYPPCCCEFFHRQDGPALDKIPQSIPGRGPFPRALNPLVPGLWGPRLLLHFPCSPQCPASSELLKRRLRRLTSLAPSLELLAEAGAGIALYGPDLGVSLVTRYRQAGPWEFEVQEVLTTQPASAVWGTLPDGEAVLRLHSHRRFTLSEPSFDDPRQFAALFH